uniref:Uncharacterized protein n=1 Tax=Megaselia scalaris TaxID=36166 RepID=T1GKL4_MEGSC
MTATSISRSEEEPSEKERWRRKKSSVSRFLILNVRDLLNSRANSVSKIEHQPRSWIETNFQKRDCVKFIPFPKDETR